VAGTFLVTPPTSLVVSVADQKAHLRIDTGAEDSLIQSLIEAATSACEHETKRQFLTATWKRVLDCFPGDESIRSPYRGGWHPGYCGAIVLQHPPLLGITNIEYVDPTGATLELASSVYQVVTDAYLGYVVPKPDQSWPATRDVPNSVTVTYTCGYSPTLLPKQAVEAVKLLVGHWYENREATGSGVSELPMAVKWLLRQIAVEEIV
jgi:gp6-like head-tail connector protein